MNIILHPEKGVNPRIGYCQRCGADHSVVLLGKWERMFKCSDCGVSTVGAQRRKCENPKCGGTRGEFVPIEDHAKVPAGLCAACETELKEHAAVVAQGGVYWKCEDCKREGVIKPSEFARDVREKHGLLNGEPCGVLLNKEQCPSCRDK